MRVKLLDLNLWYELVSTLLVYLRDFLVFEVASLALQASEVLNQVLADTEEGDFPSYRLE